MGSPSREDDAAAIARRIVQEALAARAEAREPPAAQAARDEVGSAALTPPPPSPPPGPLPSRIRMHRDVPVAPVAPEESERTVMLARPGAHPPAWESWRWLAVAVLGAVSLVVLLVLSTQALRAVFDLGS